MADEQKKGLLSSQECDGNVVVAEPRGGHQRRLPAYGIAGVRVLSQQGVDRPEEVVSVHRSEQAPRLRRAADSHRGGFSESLP